MKKLLSVFLSISLILSSLCCICCEAFALDSKGKCGTNLNYTFDYATGLLEISGSGYMTNYSGDDSPFANHNNIKSVVLDNGVLSIGKNAFKNAAGLKNVKIPSSLTSVGDYAFSGCTALKKYTVDSENKVFSSKNGTLFNKDRTCLILCPAVHKDNSYTVPDEVETIAFRAFEQTKLNEIILSPSVKYIYDEAFINSSDLKTINFTKEVIYIGRNAMFGCPNLTALYYNQYVQSYCKQNKIKNEFGCKVNNHTVCVIKGKKATFKREGKSEGEYCSACGKVLVEQKKIKKLKNPKIKKLTATDGGFTVKSNKIGTPDGFYIEYSLDSSFKSFKKKRVKADTLDKTVNKLKRKKVYYVRIRAYVKVKGKTLYSKRSTVKKVKTS